jgi:hypothetical protein
MAGIRTNGTSHMKKNGSRKATPNLKRISLCIEGENGSLAKPICDSDSKVSRLAYQGFDAVPGIIQRPKTDLIHSESARVFYKLHEDYQKWDEDTSEVE